ncbi:hypothetical protein GAY29_10885 [Azospirillum brasilense]|uniref:hypothetical protein n=1 Tax=Azospirillum brasilense TaxID=192 RepID=UPI0019095AE6|nr:hypothetical protein [Azospirillum brasilense]MBK3733614.1 hypothetical protein [Azospirillum brasilense]
MSDVFIGDLPAAVSLADGDTLPLDQGTRTVKATVAQIRSLPPNGLSGDAIHGGTVTAFASTGIGDQATSRVLTLSAAGNAGIGTTAPLTPLSVERADGSPFAAQILLRNPGVASNAAGIALQVSHPSEFTSYGPKAGVLLQRVAPNGLGAFKLYNRVSGDTQGYGTGDAFLTHNGWTGALAFTPTGGASVAGTRGEGQAILDILTGLTSTTTVCEAAGTGAGVSATAIRVQKNSVTGRSINAAGTVNATGLDYAEYMEKAADCGTIAKGQIAGVDADGRLTDRFDRAHSFVVKSTSPSYVGGDALTEDRLGPPPAEPVPISDEPESEAVERFADRHSAWVEELATWQARAEAERTRFDRIAFCGQVPVTVAGPWAVGDYVQAERVENGTPGGAIAAVAVPSDVLDEIGYRRAVGRIWRIAPDGRPVIVVKTV